MFGYSDNRKAFIIWALLGLLFVALGIKQGLASAAIVIEAVCLYGFLLYKVIEKRHFRIMRLIESIDQVLRMESMVVFDETGEGDFALLESEVRKMTVRIREHTSLLQKEKVYLSDSLSDISHQLRTPLTTVNLLVSFLQNPKISEDEKQRHLRNINLQLKRLDWLIATLLKISKLDAGTIVFKKEKVDVSKLIVKSVEPILIPFEIKEQTFECISLGSESFKGDLNWTSEALLNIIKNCMEHTQEGGVIRVRAKENSLFTEITIEDNGTGIDKEDIPHLFERFYKGKNSSDSGVGIGLALARMIIVKQNGTIKVVNKPSGGALFTIKFYKEKK